MTKRLPACLLTLVLASILVMASISALLADKGRKQKGKYEQEELYDARRAGELMPLARILEKLRLQGITQILEIEAEFDDGVPLYEIYYLDNRGRRGEIEVDARNGRVFHDHEDEEDD